MVIDNGRMDAHSEFSWHDKTLISDEQGMRTALESSEQPVVNTYTLLPKSQWWIKSIKQLQTKHVRRLNKDQNELCQPGLCTHTRNSGLFILTLMKGVTMKTVCSNCGDDPHHIWGLCPTSKQASDYRFTLHDILLNYVNEPHTLRSDWR